MDLLIKDATIITSNSVISNGVIGIEGERISFVGADCEMDAPRTISASGKIVMPGLVNTHTHIPMTLLRGYADDLPLQEWLFNKIFPIEDKFCEDDIYLGSMLALCEMIRSGTTAFCDMYFMSHQIAQATMKSGLRANLSRALQCMDEHGDFSKDTRILEALELRKEYSNDKITVDIAPHAIYTSSPEYLRYAAQLAVDISAGVHIHISETIAENLDCLQKHGATPTQVLHSLSFFKTRTVAAHCVHLDSEDIRIMAENNVNISHNPTSNLKLASGIAPIGGYLDSGINVSLGTDGAASNNKLDMFSEINKCALLQKGLTGDSTLISARQAINMATIGGARALGREGEIGEIKVGFKADLIFIDTSAPHMQPMHNPLSALVYCASGADVTDVMVDGEFLMENRNLTTLDYEKIKFETERCCRRLFE